VFGNLKYGLLACASAFVMLSKSEGMPIAALEALTQGVPVVLTKESNLPEAEEGGAGISTTADHKSAAETLAGLLSDRRRLNLMGTNARIVAQRHFSWTVVLPRVLDSYHRAAARRT
jgi:glycosyltransferase involved in cell wall biosynthesis